MIDAHLFDPPVALQRDAHRKLRWASGMPDFARAAKANSLFLTAVEIADASLDYPVVFASAGPGPDGQDDVAPIAVLGLQQGENLMLGADGEWLARYVPAVLRAHPMGLARQPNEDRYVLCIDESSKRWSLTEGEALFKDDGTPSEFLEEMRKFLEQIEVETERTRLFGRKLLELKLLESRRFDARMPDGRALTVDGFMAVNEETLAALPEAQVAELNRLGLLKLIHAHLLSLGHMGRLAERRLARDQAVA